MPRLTRTFSCCALIALLAAGCAGKPAQPPAAEGIKPSAAAAGFAAIPKDKDTDLKLYTADGRVLKGADALGRMQREAGLILWLAGNQFFAMDDVVGAFQKQQAGVAVGIITLPPGLLLRAIQTGGWTYQGQSFPGLPDVYASVNLDHLKALRKAGLMDTYAIYLHNEMELMVAQGNPKRITGIKDLVRADVRTSLPNPVSEGIMRFYGRKVLERHGLWNQIAAGKECASCQTTPNNWFTSVHHRETPERIQDGRSDTGIVWVTETMEAKREGARVDSVRLPPEDSLVDEVSYAIGSLTNSRKKDMADRYIRFLATSEAKQAYSKFGFVNASDAELRLKPIP
ncbi:MAG: substrate-binding domain-containing protein [Burkholderiales bacterium]